MARFIPGPLISAISGRVGQSIFTSYKGVGVIRQAPTSFYNPNSPAQQSARTAASYISQKWQELSDDDQSTWGDDPDGERRSAAKEHGLPKCSGSIFKGFTGPMSGFNLFLLRNYNRYSAGITNYTQILTNPALGVPRPEGLATVSAIVVNDSIIFSWTPITNVPTVNRLKLWIRSTDARIHSQLIATAPVFPAGSITITTVRGVSGIPISIPPGKYQLQAKVTDINGRESVESEILTVRIPHDNFMPIYYEPRIQLLNLVNIAASVPWTTISVAGITPPDANAVILLVQINVAVPGPVTASAKIKLRRDTSQDTGLARGIQADAVPNVPSSDCGLIPIATPKQFDYEISLIPVAAERYDAQIYAIAYIH